MQRVLRLRDECFRVLTEPKMKGRDKEDLSDLTYSWTYDKWCDLESDKELMEQLAKDVAILRAGDLGEISKEVLFEIGEQPDF